ncbi:MAG: hypothetical protein ACLVJH_16935 [Faecalibacterium prausnitzii]
MISDGQVAENGKVSYTYKKKTFLWFSSKMSGVPTEPGTYTQTAKAGALPPAVPSAAPLR